MKGKISYELKQAWQNERHNKRELKLTVWKTDKHDKWLLRFTSEQGHSKEDKQDDLF